MSDNVDAKIREVDRRISRIQLMIEKRRRSVAYYDKLLKMGLLFSDTVKLNCYSNIKASEIRALTAELDSLYTQRALYEVEKDSNITFH